MPGGRLLNRGDLDEAFPENPVRIDHVSMHGAVLNSLALKKYGISASTPTPTGGVIVRKPGSQEPWGLIMETAFIPVSQWGRYNNRFKIGGVKITIDGSHQGRTAFFTTPYLTGGPAGEKNWRGEPTFPQNLVDKAVSKVYRLGVLLLAHTNGAAAIDMFLKAYASARKGDVSRPWNVTTIHSQFLRKDQIPSFVKYGIRPHRFRGGAARSAVHALVGGEPRFRSRWLPMRSRTSTWWRRSRRGSPSIPSQPLGSGPSPRLPPSGRPLVGSPSSVASIASTARSR
jgi:predicted amidohydrolase YtcJ